MERWKKQQPQSPSFSSSLLDLICRSIDDSATSTPCLPASSTDKKRPPPPQPPAILRRSRNPSDDPRHRRFFSTTIPSISSSIVGFSSVDFDSTTPHRPVLTRSKPIRIDPPKSPQTNKPNRSIRTRIRALQKSPTSASPGSRLAALINTIFAGVGDRTATRPKLAGCVEYPVSYSSSSFSSTSKTGPCFKSLEKQERSLPFSPASIVNRCCCGDSQMMVELLRGFEKIEDLEDCESVSSSDLFELDSLSVFGEFTDDLPVFHSTT
ncbi:protein BIG GRAIN 1-like B [Phalaenopsis equestris]|uniref:protein BIG GRAIN 1-like B n=1 Tax=Phalaenopsis equestris TaxID=78828 RepID=UPI0009E2C975|nr:protein BIG GRAIN 1-like B [Phalaenopsis equestris]